LKKNAPEEIASLLMKKKVNWGDKGLERRKRFLKEFELEEWGEVFRGF